MHRTVCTSAGLQSASTRMSSKNSTFFVSRVKALKVAPRALYSDIPRVQLRHKL